MIRVGYACMNLTLGLTTSHTTRLARLDDPERVQRIVHENLSAIEPILRWNVERGFGLFRLGSSLIPFASHEDFPYDWVELHGPRLRLIGDVARRLGQRLSMHPGQYTTPGSPDPGVARRSIAELDYAATVMDHVAPDDGVVVLHVGGVYGDRAATLDRFVETLRRYPSILNRLALENDERLWSADQVHEAATRLGVPMIFDTLHHRLNSGDWPEQEALEKALETWERARPGQRPKMHISSQLEGGRLGAHADAIAPPDWHALLELVDDRDVDVMLEAKLKEGALPAEAVRARQEVAP